MRTRNGGNGSEKPSIHRRRQSPDGHRPHLAEAQPAAVVVVGYHPIVADDAGEDRAAPVGCFGSTDGFGQRQDLPLELPKRLDWLAGHRRGAEGLVPR